MHALLACARPSSAHPVISTMATTPVAPIRANTDSRSHRHRGSSITWIVCICVPICASLCPIGVKLAAEGGLICARWSVAEECSSHLFGRMSLLLAVLGRMAVFVRERLGQRGTFFIIGPAVARLARRWRRNVVPKCVDTYYAARLWRITSIGRSQVLRNHTFRCLLSTWEVFPTAVLADVAPTTDYHAGPIDGRVIVVIT